MPNVVKWGYEQDPPYMVGFPGGSDGKEFAHSAEDLGLEDPLEKGMATHSNILV